MQEKNGSKFQSCSSATAVTLRLYSNKKRQPSPSDTHNPSSTTAVAALLPTHSSALLHLVITKLLPLHSNKLLLCFRTTTQPLRMLMPARITSSTNSNWLAITGALRMIWRLTM